MAMIGRKQPAAPPPPAREQPKARPAGAAAGPARVSRVEALRNNVRNIAAELRKVTWPTREETRNLTIVVIGISATIGILLAGLDSVFSYLYRFVQP